MKVIKPSITIKSSELKIGKLFTLERAARNCYKSEGKSKGTVDGASKFLKNIIKSGHESVLEHEKLTMSIITDRGQTHAIVRHRIASYSQESTIYCNYTNFDRFGKDILFVEPIFGDNQEAREHWKKACEIAETKYKDIIAIGGSPQQARSVLPTCVKTEIVITMNLRELRWFLLKRLDPIDHTSMHQLSIPLLMLCHKTWPVLFDDVLDRLNLNMAANKYKLLPEDYAEIIIND